MLRPGLWKTFVKSPVQRGICLENMLFELIVKVGPLENRLRLS
jgi:hypothetical protein